MRTQDTDQKKLNSKIKNWATDENFAEQTLAKLSSQWRHLRADREYLEEKWQRFYRMWSVVSDYEKRYDGRADLYWPQMRKEVETMTRRIIKGLFPEDYMDVDATNYESDELAETNKHVIRHFYDNVMHIKTDLEPWAKQVVLYGTGPLKVTWSEKKNKQWFKKREYQEVNGEFIPKSKLVNEEVTLYCAPKVEVCDLFRTWISPITANNPSEIKQVYYERKVTYSQLKQMHEEGAAINCDFLKDKGKEIDNEFDETQDKLSNTGSSGLLTGTDPYYNLLECWTELDLPDGSRLPCVVYIINDSHVIRIQQNPYWHQCPPFVFGRYIKPPAGEFYGRGLPEATEYMQYQLNDTVNQTVDSATLSLNNVVVVNPAFAPNVESFEMEPSAIWWADPNGVKQFNFPDLSNVGIKNAELLRSVITQMSDNSPQLPDPIAGKARSTGQAELAIGEWQTDLYSFLEKLEIECMVPMTRMVHMLLQQYVKEKIIVRIGGRYAGTWLKTIVEPEELLGSYDFRWKGALQTENTAVKVQQMLNFMKIAGQIPAEQGVRVNWPNFIETFLTEGLQIKNSHKYLETEDLSPEVPAGIENKIVSYGGQVKVKAADDDEAHIRIHERVLAEMKNAYQRSQMELHIARHYQQRDEKAAQAQMQMQAAEAAMMQMQGGGQGGQGGPGGRNNMAGNQGQLSEATDSADLQRGIR